MDSTDGRAETELDLRRAAGRATGEILRGRGQTESWLAREIGVSPTSVHRWVTNPSKPPTLYRIKQIARHLDSAELHQLAERIFAHGSRLPSTGVAPAEAARLREVVVKMQALVEEMQQLLEAES